MKIFDKTVFDTKTYLKTLVLLVLLVPLQMASKGSAYAFLVPFALFAMIARRVEKSMFWVMSSMLMIIGNQFFFPKNIVFYVAQRVLFITFGLYMLVQLSGKRQSRYVSPFLGMLVYVAVMACTAGSGWNPMISYLKLFLFAIVYIACYGVAVIADQSARFSEQRVRAILLAVISFFTFGSLALIPFPAIGQLSGAEFEAAQQSGRAVLSLFKGMTMHSQMLGPVMASTFAFLFADLVVNVRKTNGLYVALLLSCVYLVYLSSSRTGMAALIAAVMMGGFCVMRMKGIGARWRGKVKGFFFCIVALAFVAVVASPRVRNSIARFALKYGDESVTTADFTVEGAMSSRQGTIDLQIETFKMSPFVGNGFQVDITHSLLKHPSWKELISAPIEKGVWVTAILEEGGILGFSVFVGFILIAGFKLLNRGVYTGLSVFCVMLVSNMAEFTMFSMSAMGGFTWAMVFVGVAMDISRIKRDRARCLPPGVWCRMPGA